MNDQKNKGMGNLSRTTDEIKNKLKLSFAAEPTVAPKDGSQEIGKSINKDLPIYGQSDIKLVSINTEINKTQLMDTDEDVIKSENRYKKVVPRVVGTAKVKATFCLDSLAIKQLNEIYIKRLNNHQNNAEQKSDRSSLICEAISLLFEKEETR